MSQLKYPNNICISQNGELYVIDIDNIKVIRISDGTLVRTITVGDLVFPSLCISSDLLFIADRKYNRVQVLSYTGELLRTLDIDSPSGICISPDGEKLYVASADGFIQVFQTSDWSYQRFGSQDGNGQFYRPHRLCISPDGSELYVAATFNNRIQVLHTSDGSHLRTFGTLGRAEGQFNRPSDIDLSPDGSQLYVADRLNNRIQVLNSVDGTHILSFGSGNRQFPGGLCLSPDGHELYVVDTLNNRVQVFQV
jgi:DNA-binding beta-propeller fold protein YncE